MVIPICLRLCEYEQHLKCALKVLFALPILVLALFVTLLQLVFIILPMGILSMSGCLDADLPDAFADSIMRWFHDL
jgi:hypothetical protein